MMIAGFGLVGAVMRRQRRALARSAGALPPNQHEHLNDKQAAAGNRRRSSIVRVMQAN
jgi:hypothetical protein